MNTPPPSNGSYARTSSDQQARDRTIESQLEALRQRAHADGVELLPELRFIDDGYSGAELQRPALERLRDTAAAGALDRLYILCGWRATSPTSSCCLMSSTAPVSRSSSSTTPWTIPRRETCCCKWKA